MSVAPLPPEDLQWTVPDGFLPFSRTDQVTACHVLPGQGPGRHALQAAVTSRRGGHIVLTGAKQSARRQHVADAIRAAGPLSRDRRDLVYVPRPDVAGAPQLLCLAPGAGAGFRRALRELRDELRVAWPDDLEGGPEAWAGARSIAFQPLVDGWPEAGDWLAALQIAVAARAELFRPGVDPHRRAADGDIEARQLLAAFQAHLFHVAPSDNAAPVVVVAGPSARSLIGGQVPGRREDPAHHGLCSGALHDAHGGFLIVDAADLAKGSAVLAALRSALATGRAAPVGERLRPDPVPLDLRVVVVATAGTQLLWWSGDPDLASAMLQPVQLDPRPDVTPEVLGELAGWLRARSRDTGWRPLDAAAFGLAMEHLVRIGGRGGRVPIELDVLEALVDDADAVADGELIGRQDMADALVAWSARRGLAASWARRSIVEDIVHIATQGQAVGQSNGLAVYRSSGFPFARPIRITATVGSGRGGFVDLERDVGLAGTTHNKGVRLLTGFLRGRFSRRRTLAMHATLGIEQHYGRIDGDSASLAELCTMLSALALVPLRQDRAVTGSIDQLGGVRAVGSVTVKVEGFFRVCDARGLTGHQGVIVPARNVRDLCLSDDIVAACAEGRFSVWPVNTVEEALALLIDGEVGLPHAELWPDDSLYGQVLTQLELLEATVRRASKGEGKK